ncbi:outer membrane protein assembly factor BamD [Geobacter sp. SVR]|uniref:outer membrane protein assembly factor BamD n=1 Tax=Geobacter sp. SVR TaxID=2495594 RepID=UPI00143F00AC|nr:outer membrane protein assembly factor BamD [Geobacter sp. SVR]BCS55141.1 outer membrane protein assembly factor BamD [Geobacter sp. SVR]GCF85322.1 outer membrane protein assembly factor BamD [Geobacter sp. SVR]
MKNTVKTAMVSMIVVALLQGCAAHRIASTPDEMFKEGERLFQKGDYEEAIAQWKKVKETFQSPELTTRAELSIADAYFVHKDYIEAAAAYEDFRKLHPRHERAGYALYRQAMSHYHQIHGIDTDQTPVKNAIGLFESYMKLYPGGEFRGDAEAKYGECRDKQLQYELYVGKFYMNDEKYPAAIARFEQALKVFGDLPRRDEVLLWLGKGYIKADQKPKGKEALDQLLKDFPNSAHAADAKELINKYLR